MRWDRLGGYRDKPRPMSQETVGPRTIADTDCPTRVSITGRQGTSENPTPSSSIAKRPLASSSDRRYVPVTRLSSVCRAVDKTGLSLDAARGGCQFPRAQNSEKVSRE